MLSIVLFALVLFVTVIAFTISLFYENNIIDKVVIKLI
jgi:hypothetical protein